MEVRPRIELVRRRCTPALAGSVAGMVGLAERAPGAVRRRQPAGSLLPLVLGFGEPLRIEALSEGTGAGRAHRSFVAGFSTGHADTSFERGQDCVQVFLSPLGVRRLLGPAGDEIAHRVVAVDDLAPALGEGLSERLAAASTWGQRFALVEQALLLQSARTAETPPWVAWMWREIRASGGRCRIGDLVAATGWSHRHVVTVFRRELGLSPKQAAGVVRFERAAADLGSRPLSEVALRHGYADQSHLTRACARHAGETPQQLALARRPTATTALGAAPHTLTV